MVWVFFLVWYELQDSWKSRCVLIAFINISKLSHMGLLMILEHPRSELRTELLFPLNLHFNACCYTLWGRAVAHKEASSQCFEKRAGERSCKSSCDESGSVSWLTLCTMPTHCRCSSMCGIINELLKVKSGPHWCQTNLSLALVEEHVCPHGS